jgi:hypothetical protein
MATGRRLYVCIALLIGCHGTPTFPSVCLEEATADSIGRHVGLGGAMKARKGTVSHGT